MSIHKPLESYKSLREKKCLIANTINWHFEEVLKSIGRKVTLKRKFKDPFICTVYREIYIDTFKQVFRAVRDYKTNIGFTTATKTTGRRGSKVSEYSLTFTHLGVAKFHLAQLVNGNKDLVEKAFLKKFTCGSVGKVVVSEEKPLTITYKCSSSNMELKCHFITINSFGNVTSF